MSEKKKSTGDAPKKPETESASGPAAAQENAPPPDPQAGGQDGTAQGAAASGTAGSPPPEDDAAGKPSGWAAGELEALRAENAELKDKVLRLAADMENLRRRTEREKADTAKYAVSNFARDVLTIGDNLRRAIEHVPADAAEKDPALKSFLEGVEVTERELLNMLERHGITRINPKGERFDPNHHQAMFEVQNPDVAEGTVTEVVQAGYMIAGRVLRPAMVGVAKGGPKQPKQPAEAGGEAAAASAPAGESAAAAAEPQEAETGKQAAEEPVGQTVDKSA
ncbi:MAG: hypothetical protein Kow0032_16420 [Methyloligellaceae bacterium]